MQTTEIKIPKWIGISLRALVCYTFCLLSASGASQPAASRSDELFADAPVRYLKIEIPKAGIALLRQSSRRSPDNTEEKVRTSATVREGDKVYTNVSIHLKGSVGSFRPIDSKPGLTIKFDKNVPGQHFHGLSKISLNNSVQDSTYITDKLCRELYAKAGVPVPRVDYAVVELNGRRLGLYLLVEGWDKKFLRRYFSNVDGNLYDPPGLFDIDKNLDVVTGAHPNDRSDLEELEKAVLDKNLDRRLAEIRRLVDFDRFMTLMAFDVMIWNWDGYSLFQNNYRVFHDLDAHHMVFMPHGMDQMFWKPDGPILTGRNGIVAKAVLQTEEGRRLYLERFRQLRTNLFDVAAITNRVNELAARIQPETIKDGFFTGIQHNRAVAKLNRLISQRAVEIDQQLESLKSFHKIAVNETVPIAGWEPLVVTGNPKLDQSTNGLHIQAPKDAAGAWCALVWLEEGTYTLQGRIKTSGVVSNRRDSLKGAGLRVYSTRKQAAGLNWSWFPFHESYDYEHRGEMSLPKKCTARLSGETEWTDFTYEFQLRQPLADLEILCELYANEGEAWFDPKSLKLTRKTAICP